MNHMDKPVVRYQLQQGIAVIRIDNPPVNALSQAVRAASSNESNSGLE